MQIVDLDKLINEETEAQCVCDIYTPAKHLPPWYKTLFTYTAIFGEILHNVNECGTRKLLFTLVRTPLGLLVPGSDGE